MEASVTPQKKSHHPVSHHVSVNEFLRLLLAVMNNHQWWLFIGCVVVVTGLVINNRAYHNLAKNVHVNERILEERRPLLDRIEGHLERLQDKIDGINELRAKIASLEAEVKRLQK